jgi:hypothetical protein
MDVSIHERRIFELNDKCRPTLDMLYWDGVIGEHLIDQNFYNKAMIIIADSSLFDSDQDCLKQVQADIKKLSHKKGFSQDFKWQHTNFTQQYRGKDL